jgi:hypothetical protein
VVAKALKNVKTIAVLIQKNARISDNRQAVALPEDNRLLEKDNTRDQAVHPVKRLKNVNK